MKIKLQILYFVTTAMIGLPVAPSFAQISFPFAVPPNPTAELDINTSIREPINPMHLSMNYGPLTYYGFNSSESKTQFKRFNPPSTRWPIGVWANWYNWETDTWETDDSYEGEFDKTILDHPGKRYGFPGLNTLQDELNFDILWSWNVNYDSPSKGVNRLNDRFEKGFDFNWLELGNEIFWKGQRSWATETPQLYTSVAQAHAQALKAEDPYIQIAVPVTWRETSVNSSWNGELLKDQSYYDAVTVHKYIRYTEDVTEDNVKQVMKAGKVLKNTAEDMDALFPGKPQWYTEWGVTCGQNAISVMGMNDMFLTFFKHQDVFAMNQYHQVNGMDEFLVEETGKKSAFGAGYDVLRDVFSGSEIYETIEQATMLDSDTAVVQSAAVNQNGETIVYAHNKTPNPVPFTIKFNGNIYTGNADHSAFIFSDLNEFPAFEIEDSPLSVVALQTADIVLPPYSINVIRGLNMDETISSEIKIEAERAQNQADFSPFETQFELGGHSYITITNGASTVNYDGVVASKKGIASYTFDVLAGGDVSIEVLGKFQTHANDSFWFRLDGEAWIKFDGLEGGSWKWVSLLKNHPLSIGTHSMKIARREAAIQLDCFRLTSSGGTLLDARATPVPSVGTTRIEAENYDEGGEGIGYHDRTPGNAGEIYRTDHVDIQLCTDSNGGYQVDSVSSGEWLQYPLDIETAGIYDLSLRAARNDPGNSSFRVLFDHENKTGILSIPSTGSLNQWTNITQTVQLDAGKQMMRLKLTGGDIAVNHIELTPYIVPNPWKQLDIGAVGVAGRSTGESDMFSLSASGSDIWNRADSFHYVYQPIFGNCEIIALIDHLDNTDPWAKAGIMIRESLSADAVNVTSLLSAEHGIFIQNRAQTGEITTSERISDLTAPYWMKLSRVGNTFTSYHAADGINWVPIASFTVPMASDAFIGLAAVSHDNEALGRSVFKYVATKTALTAKAGTNLWVEDINTDGIETITLDGRESRPSRTTPIAKYRWRRGSDPLASGSVATIDLPLGTHLLSLDVEDTSGTIATDMISVTIAPPYGTEKSLLAGWENWVNSGNQAATRTDLFTGISTENGWNISDSAANTDGTWGHFITDPAADQTSAANMNGALLPNGAEGYYDFAITDTSGVAIKLTHFHFDSASFRKNSSRNWALSVLSGDLSSGPVASGIVPAPAVGGQADWYNYDIALSNLTDSVLAPNGTVTLRLHFSGGVAGSLGHHQYLDNVGISGASDAKVYPDNDNNGLPDYWEILHFGHTGQSTSADTDGDGISNKSEWIAGTNPSNANSYFMMHAFTKDPNGGYALQWNSYSDRIYNVMKSPTLTNTNWISASGDLPGNGGKMHFTDHAATSPSNMFYKIEVSKP